MRLGFWRIPLDSRLLWRFSTWQETFWSGPGSWSGGANTFYGKPGLDLYPAEDHDQLFGRARMRSVPGPSS